MFKHCRHLENLCTVLFAVSSLHRQLGAEIPILRLHRPQRQAPFQKHGNDRQERGQKDLRRHSEGS